MSLLGPDQAKHIDTVVQSGAMWQSSSQNLNVAMLGCSREVREGHHVLVDGGGPPSLQGPFWEHSNSDSTSPVAGRGTVCTWCAQFSRRTCHIWICEQVCFTLSKPMEGSYEEKQEPHRTMRIKVLRNRWLLGPRRRGSGVIPQVKAGSFPHDMVVEGERDARLAIECDGDEFHGPDRWAADISRQRVLERAGWTFWRCFACHLVFAAAKCLMNSYSDFAPWVLSRSGTLEKIPSFVEQRT